MMQRVVMQAEDRAHALEQEVCLVLEGMSGHVIAHIVSHCISLLRMSVS